MPSEVEPVAAVADTRFLSLLSVLHKENKTMDFTYFNTNFRMAAAYSEAKHERTVTLQARGHEQLRLVVFFPDVALVQGAVRRVVEQAPGLLHDGNEQQWIMLPFQPTADPVIVVHTWLSHCLGGKTVAEILTGAV